METDSVWKKITGIVFLVCLIGFGLTGILLPDADISKSERRPLASMPRISEEAVKDGSYMKKLETYLLDQFAGREWFRKGKAEFETGIYQKSDTNGYYKVGEGIYQLDYELNENNVRRASEHFYQIVQAYFTDANVYYSIIPDKNYFVAAANGYPSFAYEKFHIWMKEGINGANYIDLFPLLDIKDYYATDLHWKQENIEDVATALLLAMGNQSQEEIKDSQEFQEIIATDSFLGGYARASALTVKPDTLKYLTNEIVQKAKMYDYEKKEYTSLYAKEKLEETDSYDFFLWGPRALLTIENPVYSGSRNLIVFRDSFGSSLAPLLLKNYSKITLVDLRYVSAEYAMELLKGTEYQDVLFLYNTLLLNNGIPIKNI